MRQSGQDRKGTQSNRRSSTHFRYDSAIEEHSRFSRLRDADVSITHISSTSDETIKTTEYNKNDSSLAGFDVPIFDLLPDLVDSKKDSKNDREMFWNFLEKFGRDSNSNSSECINFEEDETINHRSSTGHRIDSFCDGPKKSEFSSKVQLKAPQEKSLINETQEEESHPKPQPIAPPQKVTTETQTHLRPPPRQIRRVEESGHSKLTFKKFQEVEDEGSRYPRRMTRECGRLKFWEHEKIDYPRGGYWVNEKEK